MANVIVTILGLIDIFRQHCADSSTLDELAEIAADQTRRRQAHDLFCRIRQKTLLAYSASDQFLIAQYSFEEVCAKTLYNLSGEPCPFDREVPFKIVPNAFAVARLMDVSDAEVVRLIMS